MKIVVFCFFSLVGAWEVGFLIPTSSEGEGEEEGNGEGERREDGIEG
jgi:hypothetical protein